VARVVFAMADHTAEASGGANRLRQAGIEVVEGVLESDAAAINSDWIFMKMHGRPHVTLKLAGSLDGKVDTATPERLILTGEQAQSAVQRLRSRSDAIAVGFGTLLADDPQLTVRGVDGEHSPLRVILGSGSIPADARVLASPGETAVIAERDPSAALAILADRGIQRLLLEGGPTLAAAYLEAGVVDEVRWFISPILIGDGVQALGALGAQVALDVIAVDLVGEDVCITGIPVASGQ
jgi:diaminohydroxyphosphoribosylaminopyrimidine deaminase/5-amino-6-(5-phosphoribosylamino)uracil reductase